MRKMPLTWKAEPGSAPDSAFSAQLGKLITYYAVTRTYGHLAYVEVRGPRGGLRRLDLGDYVEIEEAKAACERHCAEGCDLSDAKKIVRSRSTRGGKS
jgi:hypothetical protein